MGVSDDKAGVGRAEPHSTLSAALEPVALAIEAAADELALMQADGGAYQVRLVQRRLDTRRVAASSPGTATSARCWLRCARVGHPIEPQLDDARRTRERMMQGVPADELHDAYRMCLRILGEQFIASAMARGIDESAILAGTRLLWDTADVLTSVVVTARQEAELDFARHDERQRIDFLRSLVFDASGQARAAPAFSGVRAAARSQLLGAACPRRRRRPTRRAEIDARRDDTDVRMPAAARRDRR